MDRSLFQLFIFVLLFGQSCAFQSDRIRRADEYVQGLIDSGNFHGSIVLGSRQGVLYENHGGIALHEWNVPIAKDTRFDIASLNKSFIGMLVMQLVEAGKVSLDDPITQYVALRSTYADSITIHQLLTHTSGLGDYDALPDSLQKNHFEPFKRLHFSNASYVDFIGALPVKGKPGEQFYYSNFAYHLLGILIEEIEAKHFSQILDSMICKPLRLSNTYSPIDNYRLYPRLAGSYQKVDETFQRTAFIDYSLGRRIFSTAEDMYLWGREMIEPTLLKSESHRQLVTNHIGKVNSDISYGYGWVVFDGKGSYRMGRLDIDENYLIHGGSTDGYRSILVIEETGQWLISMLSNHGSLINELQVAEDLIKRINEE